VVRQSISWRSKSGGWQEWPQLGRQAHSSLTLLRNKGHWSKAANVWINWVQKLIFPTEELSKSAGLEAIEALAFGRAKSPWVLGQL
jgi:hypothetical protein